MTEDGNVHNATPELLRKIQIGIAEILEQTKHIPQIRADISELQVAMAASRADIANVKDSVDALKESAQIIEHDIAGIKMRIERIERHTGLVKV
ncbi:MAG: hypothetical protein WBX25_34285 [Rhodomicrobium sp.]